VSDQAIDEIVNRVIARMTDQSVRETSWPSRNGSFEKRSRRIKLGQ